MMVEKLGMPIDMLSFKAFLEHTRIMEKEMT